MAGEWTPNNLKGSPHRIRPETHWFQETTEKGRDDGALWFSLQLTRDRAMKLYEWDRRGDFAKLIDGGARMAPTSRTALKFALDRQEASTIGTDILVPKQAFAALEETLAAEISDAGLAVAGEIGVGKKIDPPVTDETAKSTPGPISKYGPVIIAIIDDGIGIANYRFRESPTTTRIKHFLDLALIGKPTAGPSVDELLGRSWKGSDIDKLLGQDEEQIYRALGLINPASELRQPLRAAVTHGTHMLDLAAGYDHRTTDPADQAALVGRPIIAVQLPTQVAENRSDTWLPHSLKRALDWILVKADELSAELSPENKRLPLIVNGSFASMAGPQDGSGDVERRITQFVKTYRGDEGPEDLCTFVLSAGNSLELRAAAQMDIRGGEVEQIPWRVLPDDKTPSFVEIWLPEVKDVRGDAQPQQVEVFLVPPRDAPPLNEHGSTFGEAVEWRIGTDVLARVYHQRFPRPDGMRECITIAIRPTADDQGAAVVPSGLWLIKIKNTTQQELLGIDLRVHRDDVGMFARTGARQSYFDDPNYERFDPDTGRPINDERDDQLYGTRVTRQGTLSAYAFAEGVLAVGGYRRSDGQPAAYSSAGREGARAPDLAAVSERSPSQGGVLAAGTYSGSVAILNGTSVAAPQVTRALADQIAIKNREAAVTGKERETAAAVQGLKTATAVEELKTAVARFTGGPHKIYGPAALRPLCLGVGRLPFRTSYRTRIDD